MNNNTFYSSHDQLGAIKTALHKDLDENLPRVMDFMEEAHQNPRVNPRQWDLETFTLRTLQKVVMMWVLHQENEVDDRGVVGMIARILENELCLTPPQRDGVLHFLRETDTGKKLRNQVEGVRRQIEREAEKEDRLRLFHDAIHPHEMPRRYHGDVSTGWKMSSDLVQRVPEHLFTDPSLTFFFYQVKDGRFLLLVFHRLMKGLERIYPSAQEREAYILDHMLFACDSCEANQAVLQKVFGGRLRMRVFSAASLPGRDFPMEMGLPANTAFDVALTNPAFEQVSGKSSVWPEVVRNHLTRWVRPGGYLGVVVPPGIRKPADHRSRWKYEDWERMTTSCTVHYATMYNKEETRQMFPTVNLLGVDTYLIQRTPCPRHHSTFVRFRGSDAYERVSLVGMPCLPSDHLAVWKRVLRSPRDPCPRVLVHYNGSVYTARATARKLRRTRAGNYTFPVVKAVNRNGLVVAWASTCRREGGFGVRKVIFNYQGAWNPPVLDWSGRYGMSEGAFGIVVASREEGQAIVDFFTSRGRRQMFQEDCTWGTSTSTIFWKLFQFLPRDFYRHDAFLQ